VNRIQNEQTKEELLVLLVTKVRKKKKETRIYIPAYAGMTETKNL
jgi:hypothetical protein